MALAAAIHIRDVIGSRPAAAAANEGVLFFASDQNERCYRSDGATWRDIGASAVLLETKTAAGSASLDFTAALLLPFDEFMFEFVNLQPVTAGALLWMRMATGGGPTVDTGANYAYREWGLAGATGANTATGATKIILTEAVNNSVLYGVVGTLRLFSPASAVVRKMISAHLFAWQDGAGTTNMQAYIDMGVYNSTTAVTGVQFLFDTGNIALGTIRCYGIPK